MTNTVLTILKAVTSYDFYQHLRITQMATLFILPMVASPAWCEINEKFRVSLGYTVTSYDTELAIKSQDSSIDTEIDLEDDLGFDSEVEAGWIRGVYRLTNRHRLRLTYISTRRASGVVSIRDLSIEDNVIKAGASIESNFQSTIFDIDYLYSFYKRSRIELGISGGLYWLYNKSEIKASGDILIGDSDTPEFRTNYETKQKLHAPLPLFGVTGTYTINPRWQLNFGARYLVVSISDIKGEVASLGLASDYLFTKHWGMGLSITTFLLDVEKDGIVFINSLKWQHEGAQIYIVFEY